MPAPSAAVANANVMGSLTQKITQIMTAPDQTGTGAAPGRSFLAFCAPGVAVGATDLQFGDMTTKPQINSNSSFSQLVNNIPNSAGFWGPTGKRVWDIYEDSIKMVTLPTATLTAEQASMLTKAQNFLVQQVTKTNPFTNATTTVTQDAPPYAAYKTYQTQYLTALRQYNGMLIQANAPGASNAVVQDFARNGASYKQAVISAYGEWTSSGYKDYVEEALGIISNLAGQAPQALYQTLRANFDADKLTDTLGSQFYPTYVYPADPMNAALDGSWLAYNFNMKDIETFQSDSKTSSGGGGGAGWGLWSASASAQYSSGNSSYSCDTQGLSVDVQLLQIPLSRPWIRQEVFWSHGWKFSPSAGLGQVSDGNLPPAGLMPLYPTSVILARNLKIQLDMSSQTNKSSFSEISTKASFGWGPFSISGNYSHSESQASSKFTSSSSGITVPGTQIIAFVCEVLPKSPDPDPNLQWPS